MDARTRSSTARRIAARATRAAVVVLIALAGLVATPGPALAVGEVTPVVDCYRKNGNGTYTVVLGYTNRSRSAVTLSVSSRNRLSPARLDGRQPTTFQPGTTRGVLSVNVTSSEWSRSGPYWAIDGKVAFFGGTWSSRLTTCPSSTELPEEGNGTGPAIALLAAGVVGGVMVHRANRRARTLGTGSDDHA